MDIMTRQKAFANMTTDRASKIKKFLEAIQITKRLTQSELSVRLNSSEEMHCPPGLGSTEPRPWTKDLVSAFMCMHGMRRRTTRLTYKSDVKQTERSEEQMATDMLCEIQMTMDFPTSDIRKISLFRKILAED